MAGFDKDGGEGSVDPVCISVKGTPLLQIFPLNYNQKNYCKLIGSPSEKGLTQFDNKVREPSTVQFTGIVKYSQRSVIKAIRAQMKKITLSELICQFQSKSGEIDNMIIDSIEEIGEATRYDGVEVKISLTEYLEHNQRENT